MDPLLPLGVLKSCIQAYTGGFFKKAAISENNVFNYDTTTYNAFDLDFGDSRGSLTNRKHLQHSYSETQLNVIKARYNQQMENSFPKESESFCSEFPCSDTDPETENTTDSIVDVKVEDDNYLYFEAHDRTREEEGGLAVDTSLFQSLTNQVSSKMQDITTSLSGYFSSATEPNKVDGFMTTKANNNGKTDHQNMFDPVSSASKEDTQQKSSNGMVRPEPNHEQHQPQQRKRSLELDLSNNVRNGLTTPEQSQTHIDGGVVKVELPKKKFSICRHCLHREEHCICHLSPKLMQRRADHRHSSHHYRFSHHNHNYYNQQKTLLSPNKLGRSNSLTSMDTDKENFNNRRNADAAVGCLGDENHNNRVRSITDCDIADDKNAITNNRDKPDTSNALCSPTSKNKQLQNFRLSLLGSSSSSHSPPPSPSSPSASKDRATGSFSPRVVYDRTTESCVILTPDEEECKTPRPEEGEGETGEESTKKKLGVDSKAFDDAKDPLMSPFLADDEILMSLPPIIVVVSIYSFTFFLFCRLLSGAK